MRLVHTLYYSTTTPTGRVINIQMCLTNVSLTPTLQEEFDFLSRTHFIIILLLGNESEGDKPPLMGILNLPLTTKAPSHPLLKDQLAVHPVSAPGAHPSQFLNYAVNLKMVHNSAAHG